MHLRLGTGPHVDESSVDASWETWETRDDDDRNPEFRDVYTGVTLDEKKEEELQSADGLDGR